MNTLNLFPRFSSKPAKIRRGIFSPGYEHFCLAIPFLFFVLVIFEIMFVRLLGDNQVEAQLSRFVTSAIFLNSIHVYFTFVFLFQLPEFKAWIKEDTKDRIWLFLLEIFSVGAFIFFALLVTEKHVDAPGAIFVFCGVLLLIIPFHHVIKQNFGLSMLYNGNIIKSEHLHENEKKEVFKNARRERLGFQVFMSFYFMSLVLTAYRWVFKLNDQLIPLMNNVLWTITALSILFLIVNCFFCPGASRTNKLAFLSRLILYPLMPFSSFADAGLRAAHGTEYYCVTHSILKNTCLKQTKRPK